MALIECPDCGKNVSTLAQSCPNCGRPVNTFKQLEVAPIVANSDFVDCPYCGTSLDLSNFKQGDKVRCSSCNNIFTRGEENVGRLHCPSCGHISKPILRQPGSGNVEIVLWLLFLVPGMIYTGWRSSAEKLKVCPKCNEVGMLQ